MHHVQSTATASNIFCCKSCSSSLRCQVLMVCISVVSVIVYRVIMSVDYCSTASALNCLIVTTVVSSVLNAVSILILGKIYDKLAVILTNWGKMFSLNRFAVSGFRFVFTKG